MLTYRYHWSEIVKGDNLCGKRLEYKGKGTQVGDKPTHTDNLDVPAVKVAQNLSKGAQLSPTDYGK